MFRGVGICILIATGCTAESAGPSDGSAGMVASGASAPVTNGGSTNSGGPAGGALAGSGAMLTGGAASAVGGAAQSGGSTQSVGATQTAGAASLMMTSDAGFVPDPPEPADAIAVIVGYGARRVRSTDGRDWTDFDELDPEGGDDDNLFRGLGYGNGRFIAVGGAGNGFSMISLDGITWTDENREPTSFLSDVVPLGDVFVTAGGNGLRMRSLDGGVTWVDPTEYYAGHFRSIATGGGIAVAVGHTYGGDPDVGIITTTTDGADWSPIQEGGETFGSVAYGQGVFVAAGNGGRCSTSSDGMMWTTQTLTDASAHVFYGNDEFLITAQNGYYRSSDGQEWTFVDGAGRDVVGYFRGGYFALGWPATIARSDDLTMFENAFAPGGSGFTQMAVGVPGN